MKIYNLIISLLCLSFVAFAQQEEQFTQFMYNKEVLNPGYVGSEGAPVFAAGFRRQWAGFQGAPTTQTARFHTPILNDHLGLGFNVSYNNAGITNKWTFAGLYSYRIKVGETGQLALGLSASVRNFFNDYNDERLIYNENLMDGAIPQFSQNKYVPNFGLGLYYNTDRAYVGISAPRLLNSDIDFSNNGSTRIGREVLHSYMMAGYRMPISSKLEFHPQMLVKYAQNSPIDFDIYMGFIIQNKVHAGLSYRTGGDNSSIGESIDAIVRLDVTENLAFGASYDFTLSEIRNYSSGTFEFSLQYRIGRLAKGAKEVSEEKKEKKELDARNF